jgi:hypothetical protein
MAEGNNFGNLQALAWIVVILIVALALYHWNKES